ncbi:nucleotidyl transferase AbiEii/AbiGii toxin family protein [Planosporangium sp. 12N6]|uniref:nucleotidyl transferase AbiEii/AbiGii toxin family protein n=1 Tax=Planosporangium spinosum TaxID=3402278 RepID=UPI003CF5E121
MSGDKSYQTAAAFRSAVDAKLRALARETHRPFTELRREFLYQRFLARVFQDGSLWVLKGGIGLLTRIPGARHSRDIDLLHLEAEPALAEAELRAIGRRNLGDYLRFEIVRSVALLVDDALRLKTEVYAGTTKWESFDIDVSCERHFVATVEPIRPRPILEVAGVPELPTFRLYPLVDQIADKVAAMYEIHGGGEPSNRYRDLVDLALLIGSQEVDAALLLAALRSREQNARSRVTLPTAMHSPGTGWTDGYPAEARRSSLRADLQQLDAALAYVGACLNPILDGTVATGKWSPDTLTWR